MGRGGGGGGGGGGRLAGGAIFQIHILIQIFEVRDSQSETGNL